MYIYLYTRKSMEETESTGIDRNTQRKCICICTQIRIDTNMLLNILKKQERVKAYVHICTNTLHANQYICMYI